MKKIAVFVSGGGSDLQSIIDSIESGQMNAKIDVVISSKQGAFALERAKTHNIDGMVFAKKDYGTSSEMFDEIIAELKRRDVEFIVLAGYLTILTPNIVKEYNRKIINIHPSLIPQYCGMKYYGMKVHQAVVENKEKYSGATVHYVDEGADTGEIIAQERVEVLENDTAESLQARVLELEHKLLPQTLIKIFNGDKE